LRRHAVELIGERFEFVPGSNGYALSEVTAADARRTGAQGLNRNHHPARKKEAGEESEGETRQQQRPGALDRRPERGVASSTGSSTKSNQPSGATRA
jgi:hypothetical protein